MPTLLKPLDQSDHIRDMVGRLAGDVGTEIVQCVEVLEKGLV
jgi:hypothetical protein